MAEAIVGAGEALANWWLKKPAYTWFMIRDFTSIFIAGYCIFLMYVLCRSRDPQAFAAFYQTWGSPLSMVLHGVALAAAELPEPAQGDAPPGAYTC